MINQLDIIDKYVIVYPTTAEDIHFNCKWAISQSKLYNGQIASINKFQTIEIIWSMLCDHSEVKMRNQQHLPIYLEI